MQVLLGCILKSPMKVRSEIFKSYDIRGRYPDEINGEAGRAIGRAFAELIRQRTSAPTPRIILSRDCRLSSPELANAALGGLLDAGAEAVDAGITTTPMHYWIVGSERAEGGIMVTASHNPKEWNGFKFTGRDAEPIGGEDDWRALRGFMERGGPAGGGVGSVIERDYLREYVECFTRRGFVFSPLKIVADASNGAVGRELGRLFEHFSSINLVPIAFEPDGNFPAHGPNPFLGGALASLGATIAEEKADLGVMFDADADRIFFVDERGGEVSGSAITALLAQSILAGSPGSAVVYNTVSSRIVPETIRASGGKPVHAKVGHKYIKQAMREHDAVFGGEHSGHFYFRESFYAESSLFALLMVLDLRSKTGRPLSEIVAPFRSYASSGERNFTVRNLAGLETALKQRYPDGQFDSTDGLTVEYPDWWFNIRPSSNEPLVRLNVEARTPTILEEKLRELRRLTEE